MKRVHFIKRFSAAIGIVLNIPTLSLISSAVTTGCRKTEVGTSDSLPENPGQTPLDNGNFIRDHRIVDYRFNEGSGQKVYNLADPTLDDNMIPVPEQTFNNKAGHFLLFIKQNALVTDLYAENPWAEARKASRLVTSSGTGNGLRIVLTLPAGPHTVSLYVKSNTSSEQTMRMEAPRGTHSGTMTVTNSWVRQTFTFNAVPGSNQIYFVKNNSTGNPLDILIDGLKINAGSSAGKYVRPKLDITLGYTGTVENGDVVWNSRGIVLSSQYGTGMIAKAITLETFTSYVFAKLNADTNKQSYVLMDPYSDLKFSLKWGEGGKADTANSPTIRVGSASIYQQVGHVADGIPHLIVSQYDGKSLRMWIDGSLVINTALTNNVAVSLQRLILSSNATLGEYFNGEIYYASIYNSVHGADQRATMRAEVLREIAAPRNIAMHEYDRYVVFEGDSISTVGSDGEWPRHLARLFSPPFIGFCKARVGSTVNGVTSLDARKEDVAALYDPAKSKNILSVLIGTNDLVSIDGILVKNRLKTYCEYIRTHSRFIIVLCMPPDRGTHPAFQTNRQAFVQAVLADPGFYDHLVRLDLDPRIGLRGCSADTRYFFPDLVHPNDGGNAVIAALVKPTIEAIFNE